MSKKYTPLGAHLTKMYTEWQILPKLWRLITLARMAKMKKFLCPSSSQRGQLSGEKKLFSISTHFGRVAGQTVSLPSNLPRNMPFLRHFLILLTLKPCNLGWNGRNLILFVAITKPARSGFWGKIFFFRFRPVLTAQWAETWPYRQQFCPSEPVKAHISG